tara:strand:+ start:457 stop:1443 length:987 start_codon:yes stop_codon:yes gene_type:complete
MTDTTQLSPEMETIWRDELSPFLDQREETRKAAVKQLFMGVAIGAAIGIAALVGLTMAGAWNFGIFALVVITFIGGGIGANKLNGLRKEIKLGLLNRLAEALGLSYALKPAEPARFETFCEHGLVPSHNRRNFEDQFSGNLHGAPFELYEAKLVQRRKSGKNTTYVTVFQGALIRIEFPRTVEGVTIVTRDSGWFNGLAGLGHKRYGGKKMERVRLVDPTFEKIFEVYSTDQVMSRYLLTPSFMERLLSLETAMKGKKVRAAFDERHGGGELLIAVETGNLFEPGSMFKPLNDDGRVRNLIDEIDMVTGMVDRLVKPAVAGEVSAVAE